MDQYYYEEGYIDAKYHVYIAEAKVEIGPYIDEGYIDPNYYLDYSVTSSLECTAQVVVGQEVIANGSFSSSTTMTAAVNKLVNASAVFTSAFTQSAIGLRDRDIDLFAFSDAAIAVQVQVTRTTNVELSTVFSIAIDASRVRYIDAAEESLFNFDAVVERSLRGFELQTQAAFSLSVEANPNTKELVATTPMVATLSAIGGFIKQNPAQLQSFSRLFVSRNAHNNRPIQIETPYTIVNTRAKFGSGSFVRNNGQALRTLSYANDIRITNTDTFAIEGWYWGRRDGGAGTGSKDIISLGAGSIINDSAVGDNQFAVILFVNASNQYVYKILWKNSSNQTLVFNSITYTLDTLPVTQNSVWTHYAITRDSNQTVRFYINGNQIISGSAPTVGTASEYRVSYNSGLGTFDSGRSNWDEISYRKGTANISLDPIVDDPNTQVLLFHAEEIGSNTAIDDTSNTRNILQTASASLSSTASITAKLSGPERVSANLTATSTLLATISHIEGADLTAFTNASLTASAINLQGFDSTPQSEFSVSVDAVKVTEVQSQLDNSVAVSADVNRIRDNNISTDSVATQLSAVVRLAGLFADDISVFEMSIQAVKTTDTQSNQTADYSLSADNLRIRFNDAALSSQFTETSDVFVGKVGQANITAEFAQSTITSRTRDNTISANSISTVECIANNLGKIEGSLFNQASMSITAVKTVFVESVQASNTQLTAETQNSVVRDYSATITSSCNVSANAVKNIGTFAFLTAFASNLTVAVKDVVSDSDMVVISSISIDAVKTVNAVSDLSAVIEQQTSAVKNVVVDMTADSQFIQATTAITVLTAHADFDSVASSLAAVVKIGDFFINADVVANANINGTVIRSANSNNQINTNVSVIGSVTKHADSVQSAQFNQTVAGSLLVSANANIQSAMQFVAAVRELRLDDIVYVIPAEIWEYQIGAETREYTIGSETREYIIQGD